MSISGLALRLFSHYIFFSSVYSILLSLSQVVLLALISALLSVYLSHYTYYVLFTPLEDVDEDDSYNRSILRRIYDHETYDDDYA